MGRKRVDRECANCGKPFKALAYNLARGKGRYCSAACGNRWSGHPYVAEKDRQRRNRRLVKVEVLTRYGGCFCVCCGESGIEFLTIDHMNNDGAEHRKKLGGGGIRLYPWLKKNGYPSGYQVLCYNCNIARHWNGGVCPHRNK